MGIVRVVMTATFLGQRCQNVLHFLNPDGALTHLEISEELKPNFITQLRNVQNNQCSWTQISVQNVGTGAGPADVYSITGAAGSLSGAGAVPAICPVVSIRTGTAGRHGHGRFYIMGLHAESIANGTFQTDALAAYQTYVNNIKNRYKSGGTGPITMVVCPRSDPMSYHVMTDLIVRPIFGIQRRRNIGVGS